MFSVYLNRTARVPGAHNGGQNISLMVKLYINSNVLLFKYDKNPNYPGLGILFNKREWLF